MDDLTGSAIALNNALSQNSDSSHHPDSQTASEFIDNQLQLEADAREALPYAFDQCTQPLGPLRQNLYSCLTCRPPPSSPSEPYTPAAVCYSCSIACHGEHTLVELFNRRNFTCDCGTTRLPSDSPCTLRIDPTTGMKRPVHSQPAAEGNTYNANFQNRFCGCGEVYDAHAEKGTMFQCLGLATEAEGGCGEDWWHPECVVGLGRSSWKAHKAEAKENTGALDGEEEDDSDTSPPGFPQEDEFETFICYKCVDVHPWIRRYAGSAGFLPAVYKRESDSVDPEKASQHDMVKQEFEATQSDEAAQNGKTASDQALPGQDVTDAPNASKKRKAEDDLDEIAGESPYPKRQKSEPVTTCHYSKLPEPSPGKLSLFLREGFRDHMCRCPKCYSTISKHPQLLEEEESYEPPLSEDGDEGHQSAGTGSLLDRGEAALSNVDRVRAIEGVMVYNHLKDKVKSFLQPFAESGQAVGAEDIKAYFEKLRGDEQGMKSAQTLVGGGTGNGDGDSRKEQSGY